MGTNEVKSRLERALQNLSFVGDFRIEVSKNAVDGEVFLEYDCFVKILYIKDWLKFSFSLILDNQRVWAIDKDKRLGWHRHPLHHTEIHEAIAEQTIEQIVDELKDVWQEIQSSKK
jgi:hypothetical protein